MELGDEINIGVLEKYLTKLSTNLLIRHWEVLLSQIYNASISTDLIVEVTLIMLSTIVEEDVNHAIQSMNIPESWSHKQYK